MRSFMLAGEPNLIQKRSPLDRDNSRKTPQPLPTRPAAGFAKLLETTLFLMHKVVCVVTSR